MHWAAQYIGLPWVAGATGPEAFDCWGLVCTIQREAFGVQMPALSIGRAVNDEALHAITQQWRTVGREPRAGDILTMRGSDGPHVGVVLDADDGLGCLHAVGPKPPGMVIFSRFDELAPLGFGRLQVWGRDG